MSYRIIQIGMILMTALGGCHGCKDKVDPCKDLHPITASFKTRENVAVSDYMKNYFLDIPCDTIIENGEFTAAEENATSYTWKVGSGVYQGKKLSLGFGNVVPGTLIPVKLIVRKTPITSCFPNDDGIDSVTKNIRITRGLKEGGSLGFFRATYEMPDYDDPSKTIQFGTYQEENYEIVRGFGFPKETVRGDVSNSVDGGVITAIQVCYVVGSNTFRSTIRLVYKGGNSYYFYGEFYPVIDGKRRPELVRKYHSLAHKI